MTYYDKYIKYKKKYTELKNQIIGGGNDKSNIKNIFQGYYFKNSNNKHIKNPNDEHIKNPNDEHIKNPKDEHIKNPNDEHNINYLHNHINIKQKFREYINIPNNDITISKINNDNNEYNIKYQKIIDINVTEGNILYYTSSKDQLVGKIIKLNNKYILIIGSSKGENIFYIFYINVDESYKTYKLNKYIDDYIFKYGIEIEPTS